MFELMPFSHRNSLFNQFDHWEKSFWGGGEAFRTDIINKEKEYVLQAELPGFQKEDISIHLDDHILTIRAEHKEEKESNRESDHYIRRERRYGAYSRSFDVSGIAVDGINACYKDGVLELTLPKSEPHQPEQKRIDIH